MKIEKMRSRKREAREGTSISNIRMIELDLGRKTASKNERKQ